MTIHFNFGGSTAARTMACPAWVRRASKLPRGGSNTNTRHGTMHHNVQEMCRLEDITPEDVLARGYTYTEDGHDHVFNEAEIGLANTAYDALDTILDEYDIDMFLIEPLVMYTEDKIGGSIDYLGCSFDGKTLLVADYKFGRSEVSVENNKQLLFYAMCARKDPKTKDFFKKVKKIVLAIIQPKVSGKASQWSCTPKDLDTFEKEYLEAVNVAENGLDLGFAGSHCGFCPVSGVCQDRQDQAVKARTLDVSNTDKLVKALSLIDEVRDWANSVEQLAHTMLEKGETVPGWKLVGKKATRRWIDPETACKKLISLGVPEDKVYIQQKPKLITGPQGVTLFNRLVKNGDIVLEEDFDAEDLIEKVAPEGTTMAPEDDVRPAIKISPRDDLKKIKNLKI